MTGEKAARADGQGELDEIRSIVGQFRDEIEALKRQLGYQQQTYWEGVHQHNLLRDSVQYHRHSLFKPRPDEEMLPADSPFMRYANCQAADFYHPYYAELAKLIGQRPNLHRKQWEWVYILHKLLSSGVVTPGSRGLVFGVGVEPLPAVFASMGAYIMATDAPPEAQGNEGWVQTSQYGSSVEALFHPSIIPDSRFRELVEYRHCDMNHIDSSLKDFDFNWSSCSLEHLGTLDHGADFVVNAVENTLRIGGIAVHTTEFNASSNTDTLTEGPTVIYRRRDIEKLVARLQARGHHVEPFEVGPVAHHLDYHVDVPPYHQQGVHLKLLIDQYVCTSVGLVVRRGR